MVVVICSVLNGLVVIADLNIHRLYVKLCSDKNSYEIVKWVIGICSSAITFLLTVIISTFAITSGTVIRLGWLHLNPGWIELGVGVIIAGWHFVCEFKKYYRNEIDKKSHKAYDGVFAVSAIIMTKARKLLLVTRNQEAHADDHETYNIWVQPGVYYRTNTLHKDPPALEPFYDHLVESIESECGLRKNMYKSIQLSSIVEDKQDTFAGSGLTAWSAKYNQNKLTATPFLIQVEEAEVQERSKTKRHIDCFYAFELQIDDDKELLESIMETASPNAKYKKLDTFTYEEVIQMSQADGLYRNQAINRCYPDLSVILGQFFAVWRKELFLKNFKNNIRHCTFNLNNYTIWVRINHNCNLKCGFCLMVNRGDSVQSVSCNMEKLHEFWNSLDLFNSQRTYHLVVTGGEPFLVKDLFNVILYMDGQSNGKITSITICTNGTLGTADLSKTYYRNARENLQKLLSNDCCFKDKLKFVINMSSYDDYSLSRIASANSKTAELHRQQCNFIECLHKNNIHNVVANVVMTDILRSHLQEYFALWKSLNIRNIAFSYAIQLGINSRSAAKTISTLSKDECVEVYYSLASGEFPIEFFDHIELMIPSCDEKKSCRENKNIVSCYMDSSKNWHCQTGCLDVQ